MARLEWTAQSAKLIQGSQVGYAANLESLVYKLTGTPLPTAALVDWLGGKPTPAEGWNQNKQRAYAFWYDQHKCPQFPDGRPWWSVVERPADGAAMPMPVGEVQPVGWAAPWFPPPHLITRSIGRSKPGASMYEHRFVIDYGSLVADDSASMREYYRRAAQAAAQLKEPIPQYGQDVSWGLAQIIGSPPR